MIIRTSPYNHENNFPVFIIASMTLTQCFYGNCFQSKAARISSLPLKSGCSINRMIVLLSIMATKFTPEIETTNWEKKISVIPLWVNLIFFSIREKNNTHKNCCEQRFWNAIGESVYIMQYTKLTHRKNMQVRNWIEINDPR